MLHDSWFSHKMKRKFVCNSTRNAQARARFPHAEQELKLRAQKDYNSFLIRR